MSGLKSRRKGVTGERECADLWVASGWTARGVEGSGDWLAIREREYPPDVFHLTSHRETVTVHVEVKRQERLRMAWHEQAKAEAPSGVPPVVCWRPNRGEWLAMLPLNDLLELIG